MNMGRKLGPDQCYFPRWGLRAKQGKYKDRDEEAEDKETERQTETESQRTGFFHGCGVGVSPAFFRH